MLPPKLRCLDDHAIARQRRMYARLLFVVVGIFGPLFADLTASSAHFPKFVLHCRTRFHELRKVMGTSKPMILVPLSI
jgi:hypothetical protein